MTTDTTTLPWQDLRDGFADVADLSRPAAAEGPAPATDAEGVAINLSEVVSALSCALDITEGQPEGHAVRTCVLGMKLAELIGLDDASRSALFYALQLKDLGCSSNAARVTQLFGHDDHQVKRDFKTTDWPRLINALGYIRRNLSPDGTRLQKLGRFIAIGASGQKGARQMVKIRCERGAAIARMFGLPELTAQTIHDLDEHWNGAGHPDGLRGEAICLTGRIASLAQTVEVFAAEYGPDTALVMALGRRKRWFDPALVDALLTLRHDRDFWADLYGDAVLQTVRTLEPTDRVIVADDERLDRIALGFAQVVDAKSPWTRRHSEKVTEVAVGIGRVLGFGDEQTRWFRRAALLHDIGKLGVSNSILDKPGKLTEDERQAMMLHPMFTHRILQRVRGFGRLTEIAASHHERLDGKGYHRGVPAKHLTPAMRALVVADMFEAISAERPYRDTMPLEKVFDILDGMVGAGICPNAFNALKFHVDTVGYTPSSFKQAA